MIIWESIWNHWNIPRHAQKIGAFHELFQKRVIGPLFFETTITVEHYQKADSRIHCLVGTRRMLCLVLTRQCVTPHFEGINNGNPVGILRQSLNFSSVVAPIVVQFRPLDFFQWEYIKDRDYINAHTKLEDLKVNITAIIDAIPRLILQRMTAKTIRTAHICLYAEGGQFQHTL